MNNVQTEALIRMLSDAARTLQVAAAERAFPNDQHDRHWACRWKREKISVGSGPLITAGEHDFFEVLMQSANIARLIDVLEWVRDEHAALHVRSCDPTQGNKGDVDLVAENKKTVFLFEITDTSGIGFHAKRRRQVNKLNYAMDAMRNPAETKAIRAFHVAGSNARIARSLLWARIGSNDTFLRDHLYTAVANIQRRSPPMRATDN